MKRGLSVLAFLVSASALAQSTAGTVTYVEAPRVATPHRFGLALVSSSYSYKERVPAEPTFKSNESGRWFGPRLSYAYMGDGSWSTSFMASFLSSNLKYDGATWTGQPLTFNHVDELRVYRASIDADVARSGRWALRIFGQIERRIWDRDLGNPHETYKFYTLPMGFEFRQQVAFSAPTFVIASVMLRPNVIGHMNVREPTKTYANHTLELGPALGWAARAGVGSMIDSHLYVGLNTEYRLVKIGAGPSKPLKFRTGSPTGMSVMEPQSRAHEFDISATLGWAI